MRLRAHFWPVRSANCSPCRREMTFIFRSNNCGSSVSGRAIHMEVMNSISPIRVRLDWMGDSLGGSAAFWNNDEFGVLVVDEDFCCASSLLSSTLPSFAAIEVAAESWKRGDCRVKEVRSWLSAGLAKGVKEIAGVGRRKKMTSVVNKIVPTTRTLLLLCCCVRRRLFLRWSITVMVKGWSQPQVST